RTARRHSALRWPAARRRPPSALSRHLSRRTDGSCVGVRWDGWRVRPCCALRLAILALIQVAALPSLVMRPPEGLAIALPRPMLARHLALLFCEFEKREQIASASRKTSVRGMGAYNFPATE